MRSYLVALAFVVLASPGLGQGTPAKARLTITATRHVTLPVNTLVEVTPAEEITSKDMKEGTTRAFFVARDVVEQGVVVIRRGASVTAEVTRRTGKGLVGKSAKFELTFRTVRVDGRHRLLRGTHRQEGRGNPAGALLAAGIITDKSATMAPGQIVNVFTNEPITVIAP